MLAEFADTVLPVLQMQIERTRDRVAHGLTRLSREPTVGRPSMQAVTDERDLDASGGDASRSRTG